MAEMDPAEQARLEGWLSDVAAELGVTDLWHPQERDRLLEMVGKVAHGVSRPGAPLTAFLVGLAAGRHGGSAPSYVDQVVDLVARQG